MNKKITWLHLSDLHVGQSGQYLWPNFKDRFFDDLRLVVDLSGSVDLVLFTGDLTQTGAADEFERLTDQLEEIWLVLKECGCAPSLVCVPGNHDLVRPNPRDARVKQLHRWHDDPDVREDFWAGGDSQYRDVIQQAFENYERWKVSLSGRTISTLPTSKEPLNKSNEPVRI
ncbi:hypothetical protein C1I89_03755 [Achromobacter pulmonis]|uniref:Calcineurin-like phosphoesterase domain-containing protein n=1 Tax=Achromobacter pulmonis TaxID=1389932 RepID=A0A2N8KPU5_9BURK|nr:hypothetical protein C1I89_03755 [Achromobacter pulmonis]